MLRSMYSGISGMKNFQTKLDVIGNNIANVNTAGFKKGRVTFKDTMNQTISGASAAQANRGGKNPMQVGLGSTMATIDTIHTQSSLQTTGRSLDLAVNGDGYFVVKQGDAEFYTRAGNMYLDDKGNLVNADGYKVQAFKMNPATGAVTNEYGDVTVNVNAVMSPTPTDSAKIAGELSATATDGTDYVQQIDVVDNNGVSHKVELNFEKNGAGWDVTGNGNQLGRITFNGGSAASDTNPWVINDNGATINVRVNLQNLVQSGNQSTAIVSPNGNLEGSLESFNIGQMGEINGVYSNGLVTTLGQVALAKFSNPSGLTKAGGNLFQQSINSGTPNVSTPGDGLGTLAAGSLEMSNVDLSEEFTEMITAQRGFQANTRIITTSDEILQELVNLKR
ncbi:flagellar basal-body rod protein FlgF [Peribacillus sp. SCS-37]|uniref:flagellar basal-body rod protein FlgF n=1 Tax=Paraperibacillus esterisolvens TaxID=3115296 RepID=UPI003906C575